MLTVDFDKLQLQPGDLLLDLGCGEGRHALSAYALADVHAIALDLGFEDLQTAQTRYRESFAELDTADKTFAPLNANGYALPFADHTFDKIICSEVLEHIPDFLQVLREIKRVLKPGGIFCATVPRYWPEKICWLLSDEYPNTPGGHIRIFTAPGLRREIELTGFQFQSRHWAHALHSPFWWLKCIFWGNDDAWPVRQYHRLLVWDLMKKPWLTQTLEKLLNPIMGKSVALYFTADDNLAAAEVAEDVPRQEAAA